MRTKVTGTNLHKLIERCQDLEKRGYECVSPIKKVNNANIEIIQNKAIHKYGSVGVNENMKYECVYAKAQ